MLLLHLVLLLLIFLFFSGSLSEKCQSMGFSLGWVQMFAGVVSLEKMEAFVTVWEIKSVTEKLSAVSEWKVVELLQLWELQ